MISRVWGEVRKELDKFEKRVMCDLENVLSMGEI